MRCKAGSISVTIIAVLLCHLPARAQQRPLLTEDPDLVRPGSARIQFGFEFLQDQPFSLSGLEGDLTRVGVLGINFGLGERAQFELRWSARDFLNIERRFAAPGSAALNFAGNSTSDSGNLQLGMKLKLRHETRLVPALGFRFAVELPNASNESGLGNDTINFFGMIILGKRMGRVHAFSNLGLAIMDRPTQAAEQSDKFIYGVATIVRLNRRLNAVAEVNGRTGNSSVGTEDLAQARFGAQIFAAGLRWDLVGIAGLTGRDPNSGVAFGVSYELPVFRPPDVK